MEIWLPARRWGRYVVFAHEDEGEECLTRIEAFIRGFERFPEPEEKVWHEYLPKDDDRRPQARSEGRREDGSHRRGDLLPIPRGTRGDLDGSESHSGQYERVEPGSDPDADRRSRELHIEWTRRRIRLPPTVTGLPPSEGWSGSGTDLSLREPPQPEPEEEDPQVAE